MRCGFVVPCTIFEQICADYMRRNARKDSKGENEEKRKVADTSGQLGVGAWNSSPNVWHLCQGTAAVVNFGLFEVVGGIHRVQPSVYHDAEKNDFCVFQGQVIWVVVLAHFCLFHVCPCTSCLSMRLITSIY